MKRLRSVFLASMAGAVLSLAGPAAAADDPGVIPMEIRVGEVVSIGPGPVRNLICDNPGLVEPTDQGGSPGLRGVSPGTTLCSVTDTLSIRRTYRVVVVVAPPAASSKSGGGE